MLSQIWTLWHFPVSVIHWTGLPALYGSAHLTWALVIAKYFSLQGQQSEDGVMHTQLWLTLSEAWSWCLQQSKWISTSIPRIVISFSTNTSSWSCGQCWGVWHKPGIVSGCATVATITQHQTAYKLLGLIVLSQHFVIYSALLDSEGHWVPVDFDWVYVGHNDVWLQVTYTHRLHVGAAACIVDTLRSDGEHRLPCQNHGNGNSCPK